MEQRWDMAFLSAGNWGRAALPTLSPLCIPDGSVLAGNCPGSRLIAEEGLNKSQN